MTDPPTSVAEVDAALRAQGYLPGDGLATAVYLSLSMGRPLLLEGEPGVGKTEVAKALAAWLGGEFLRLQCYEGLDASQSLYEWDHARQLLHLRAAEAAGVLGTDVDAVEDDLHDERFLIRRPLLRAIADHHAISPVLLIDEIDRADDEFEAFLLEVLADNSITIPELGTFRASVPPVVVITSNRTRDVHDALKRRCLYHWVDHPDLEREIEIVRARVPRATDVLTRQVAVLTASLRGLGLYKPPGVAETIDWVEAFTLLGREEIDLASTRDTLGAAVKYREDAERIERADLAALVDASRAAD